MSARVQDKFKVVLSIHPTFKDFSLTSQHLLVTFQQHIRGQPSPGSKPTGCPFCLIKDPSKLLRKENIFMSAILLTKMLFDLLAITSLQNVKTKGLIWMDPYQHTLSTF